MVRVEIIQGLPKELAQDYRMLILPGRARAALSSQYQHLHMPTNGRTFSTLDDFSPNGQRNSPRGESLVSWHYRRLSLATTVDVHPSTASKLPTTRVSTLPNLIHAPHRTHKLLTLMPAIKSIDLPLAIHCAPLRALDRHVACTHDGLTQIVKAVVGVRATGQGTFAFHFVHIRVALHPVYLADHHLWPWLSALLLGLRVVLRNRGQTYQAVELVKHADAIDLCVWWGELIRDPAGNVVLGRVLDGYESSGGCGTDGQRMRVG
jgi:hypothetical protein